MSRLTISICGRCRCDCNVGGAAVAADYTGPTMDLSKVQPEFRIGFLGDEAAQDILDPQRVPQRVRRSRLRRSGQNVHVQRLRRHDGIDAGRQPRLHLVRRFGLRWPVPARTRKQVEPVMTRMQPTGDTGYYSVMVTLAPTAASRRSTT